MDDRSAKIPLGDHEPELGIYLPAELWVIIVEYVCVPLTDAELYHLFPVIHLAAKMLSIDKIRYKSVRQAHVENILRYSTVSKLFRCVASKAACRTLQKCVGFIQMPKPKFKIPNFDLKDCYGADLKMQAKKHNAMDEYNQLCAFKYLFGDDLVLRMLDFYPICRECRERIWHDDDGDECLQCRCMIHITDISVCYAEGGYGGTFCKTECCP